jgi:(p)ppGpp synthase/HD superfamily hydrolase
MKPNKQNIINDILIELEKGIERVDCLAIIANKWQTATRTFDRYWKEANEQYKIKLESINKSLLEQSTEEQKERLKSGLKSKTDRLLILQNLIDNCLEQLTTKECEDVYFQNGEPYPYQRQMNQRELNDTRKTLNTLQIEISKIQGDYAPQRIESESNINFRPKIDFD